jgi:protein-disulfide isomerase
MGLILVVLMVLTGMPFSSSIAVAEPMSAEQGEAILKELKEIKGLLQDMAKQPRGKPTSRRPTEARVEIAGAYSLGRDDAPLTMVEFTDFQCPYCKRFHDVVFPELKRKYIDTGKLRYVSRDLPLEFHADAMFAANAGRCAGEQNKFWGLRDALFANARNLKPDAILGYAKALSMDMTRFQRCLDTKKYNAAIAKDIRDANAAGFTGTPSFVIGKSDADGVVDGVAVVGAKPFPYIEDKIKEVSEQD